MHQVVKLNALIIEQLNRDSLIEQSHQDSTFIVLSEINIV